MTKTRIRIGMLYGAGFIALCLVTAGPAGSTDSRQQSTGPGVVQGEDGSMSTKQGGNTGATTGRNEQSGSATGAVRDPSKAEPPPGKQSGSGQGNSGSSQETRQKQEHKRAGAHTDK